MTTDPDEGDAATLLKKSAIITVTAVPKPAPDWVEFSMSAKFSNGGGNQNGKDELKFNRAAGDFDLQFDLDDKSGLNLAFLDCFADAIWVQPGTNCPPAGPGNGNGTITSVSWNKKQLIVNNANARDETLTFMLRFSGDKKDELNPPYEYDPKIINGGG